MIIPIHGTDALIHDGEPLFGFFDGPLKVIDRGAVRYLDPFGKPYGPLRRWARFKQIQYFGGISSTFVFGCAMADLRYLASVFFYIYDVGARRLTARSFRVPLSLGLTMSDNPVSGESVYRKGDVEAKMSYEGSPRRKSLVVRLGSELELRASMSEEACQPMSLCTRAGYDGWVYANKTAGLPVSGRLTWGGAEHDLEALGTHGHHDFSCGYMRRETYWNWACLSGLDAEGHALGLNVSCGVNETSYSENCAWLDGSLIRLGLARFVFDRADVMKPWEVKSQDGAVDLRFTPLGLHEERMQAGLVASNFRQVFGYFEGEMVLSGRARRVNRIFGFVEDQYVKW